MEPSDVPSGSPRASEPQDEAPSAPQPLAEASSSTRTVTNEVSNLEQALSASEAIFRQQIDSLPIMAWSLNANLELEYLSRHYLDYVGDSADIDVRGWGEVHPDDLERCNETYEYAKATGVTWECELRLRRFDSVYRWHLSRLAPIVDQSGAIYRWFGASTDIQAQKEAEDTLRASADKSRFLLRINDLVRGISDPQQALNVVVREVAEYIQSDRCSYMEINVEENWMEVLATYARRGTVNTGRYPYSQYITEETGYDKPDTAINCDVHLDKRTAAAADAYDKLGVRAFVGVTIRKDGRIVGSFGVNSLEPRQWTDREVEVLEDVAERTWQLLQNTRAEIQIRSLNADLERRVVERTAELRAANRELEGFTYSVSHDLRGPLRSINTTSKILSQDFGTVLPEEGRNLLKKQWEAASKLGRLIDDLLRLTRLARQEMLLSRVSISSIATQVVEELDSTYRSDSYRFDITPDLEANGDPVLIKFVLLNLIENAVKFSPGGGCIRVGLKETADANAFFVSDEGIGFDMKFSEKLFRPFERLVRDEEFEGTGIGLANVQRIVERHGGQVWADSTPGKGATFYFNLNAEPLAPQT